MSEVHWTQLNHADLKKYVFKLKGEIDKLKSEKPKREKSPTTVGYQVYNENARLRKLVAELQNKDPKEIDMRDDFLFVSSLTNVPINQILKTKLERSNQSISNARRMLAVILRTKGMGLTEIAKRMGYNDHTSVLHLIRTAGLLPEYLSNHLHHYLNKENETGTII